MKTSCTLGRKKKGGGEGREEATCALVIKALGDIWQQF